MKQTEALMFINDLEWPISKTIWINAGLRKLRSTLQGLQTLHLVDDWLLGA